MKSKILLVCMFAFAMILSPVAAQDQEAECDVVYLFNGWARATVPGAPNGAVFGFLVNLTGETDTLVGASTDVAEVVELHEMAMTDDDVMQMRMVEGGFVIEPNNYLELAPGGLHIMLINLQEQLAAGETLDLVLEFENEGEVALTVPIMDSDDDMAAHDMPMMEWDEACQGLHLLGGWARPAMAGMPNSAAYGLFLNLTGVDDVLISGTTEVAEALELHEMSMTDDDVMQMRPVEGGIPLPSDEAVLLKPGGLHIMWIGLTQALEVESTIDMQLQFESYGALDVTVPIQEPSAETMDMSG